MDIVNKPAEGNPDAVTESVEQIPDNLQGKSASELVSAYKSLESKLGSQSNELGELRRALQQQQANTQPQTEEESPDFYSDPEKYIQTLVKQQLAPVASVIQQQQERETERQLDSKFNGWRDTVKATEFQEWVKNSEIRKNLWTAADFGDYSAAAELFQTWDGLSSASTSAKASTEKAVKKDRALRDAATEKGTPRIDGRKILKRADLQELRRLNPDRYNQLAPEIRKAYAEGRVRD